MASAQLPSLRVQSAREAKFSLIAAGVLVASRPLGACEWLDSAGLGLKWSFGFQSAGLRVGEWRKVGMRTVKWLWLRVCHAIRWLCDMAVQTRLFASMPSLLKKHY